MARTPICSNVCDLILFKGTDVKLLPDVSIFARFQGERTLVSFEGSEHISGEIVVGYDGFIPLSILVDLSIGLDRGVKHHLTGHDGDIALAQEGGRVDRCSDAGPDILIIATRFRASEDIPGQANKGLAPPAEA